MAINRISGNILQDNLLRGSNLAIETDLIYFNVIDDRVGINTANTTHTLTINGNVNIATELEVDANITGGNITSINSIAATGNIDGGNVRAPSGQIYASTGFFLGNVDVLGNLNATIGVVYANSGIFYGNVITGVDAAFAGVPGFTPLGSNVVMQFAANVNSYAQLNFENINNGTLSSTDIVLTANNGDDSTYYADFGLAGSTHLDPDFFGDLPYCNNDAYLYVTATDQAGPSSDSGPGNLILGSTNGIIKMFVGNTAQANVITTISSSGMTVVGNLESDQFSANDAVISGNLTTANLSVTDGFNPGNFSFTGSTITLTVSPSDIILEPTGTGVLVIDTTTAVEMPVGNIAQRPANAAAGSLRYSTDAEALEYYNGSNWVAIEVNFEITSQTITPNGATNTFTLDQSATAEGIIVTINGVTQVPNTNYTVSGDQFTLQETPLATDIIEVRFIAPVPNSGAVFPGTATQLGYYATSAPEISQTGANLTWNGANSLAVVGGITALTQTLTPGSEPANPVNGMLAVADGTTWNPGADNLQHLMIRLNGAWSQII